MMKKHKSISRLISLVQEKFQDTGLEVVDYWEQYYFIGFKKADKLIFVSTEYKKCKYYFCECEILLSDPDKVYDLYYREENIREVALLKLIGNFLQLSN
jgi:hypothetical protein